MSYSVCFPKWLYWFFSLKCSPPRTGTLRYLEKVANALWREQDAGTFFSQKYAQKVLSTVLADYWHQCHYANRRSQLNLSLILSSFTNHANVVTPVRSYICRYQTAMHSNYYLFWSRSLLVKYFDWSLLTTIPIRNSQKPFGFYNYQPLSLPAMIPLNLKTTPRQRLLAKNFMKTVEWASGSYW